MEGEPEVGTSPRGGSRKWLRLKLPIAKSCWSPTPASWIKWLHMPNLWSRWPVIVVWDYYKSLRHSFLSFWRTLMSSPALAWISVSAFPIFSAWTVVQGHSGDVGCFPSPSLLPHISVPTVPCQGNHTLAYRDLESVSLFLWYGLQGLPAVLWEIKSLEKIKVWFYPEKWLWK